MNKPKREAKQLEFEKNARRTMEQYVVASFQPRGQHNWHQVKQALEDWEKKVLAMTMKQLVHEYEIRDGQPIRPDWTSGPSTKADIG